VGDRGPEWLDLGLSRVMPGPPPAPPCSPTWSPDSRPGSRAPLALPPRITAPTPSPVADMPLGRPCSNTSRRVCVSPPIPDGSWLRRGRSVPAVKLAGPLLPRVSRGEVRGEVTDTDPYSPLLAGRPPPPPALDPQGLTGLTSPLLRGLGPGPAEKLPWVLSAACEQTGNNWDVDTTYVFNCKSSRL
jgi:hypothetical protein